MRRHGRLPWPAPAELDDGQRPLYAAIAGGPRAAGGSPFPLTDADGRLEGPFNAMLVHPPVGDAVQVLGARIRYASGLSAREREIAILAVAARHGSDFERYAHERVGRAVGLTEVELAGIATGRTAASLSSAEGEVLRVVRRLVGDRDLDDATYAVAERVLGVPRLADLVVLVGYYEMLALSLRVWRTPLPADD